MKKTHDFSHILLSTFLFCSFTVMPAVAANLYDSKFVLPEYSKKVSMDLKDAMILDVLKIFSQQTDMNFIAADDLSDLRVTLYFEEVPIEEALEQILSANKLTYERDPLSSVVTVRRVQDDQEVIITKVYSLKHAAVPSSKLHQTITIDGVTTTTTSSDNGILAAVKAILSSAGKIAEDARTNSLIITDAESNLSLIEETIAMLDVAVPQILIEVEMLDVSKRTTDKIGSKFGEQPLRWTGATKQHLWPFIDTQDAVFADGKYTAGTVNASGLDVILQFLRTQTDTKSLARPRLLTINNETAEIKISTNEGIANTSSIQSSDSISSETVEVERVETGVFLTVTPQANVQSGIITMAIAPRVIEATEGATFGGQTIKDPEERGSSSILKVKTGETIILGGLLRTDETKTETKVPFFGDLPFVGNAFRHENTVDSERELLIFITPRIVDADDYLKSPMESSYQKQQAIERELQLLNIEKQIF